MKVKTSELQGAALDWAVAKCEGDKVFRPRIGRPDNWDKEAYMQRGEDDRWVVRVQNPTVAQFVDWTYCPSRSWMQGGPIIERERFHVRPFGLSWECSMGGDIWFKGPTPLVAAMRCYVASKLGDEVAIPEALK